MVADPLLLLPQVLLDVLHLLVQLRLLAAAVVLEAHHRVDAAYSRSEQRHCHEDGSSVGWLFLDLMRHGHGWVYALREA